MKIGIGGANGFIGKHLVQQLGTHHLRLLSQTLSATSPVESSHFQVDVVKEGLPAEFIDGLDVFVFLIGSFSNRYQELVDTNLVSLFNALQCIEKSSQKPRIVFASSCAVYGETPHEKVSDEDDLCLPSTPYGFAKKWAEEYLAFHANLHSYSYAIVRFPNVYGNGSRAVMSQFLSRLVESSPIVIEGDGLQERDFLCVDDAIAGLKAAIFSQESGVFNISTGRSTTLLSLLTMLSEEAGRKPLIEKRAPNPNTQRRSILNPAKAARVLGWTPQVDLEAGVRMMVAFEKEHKGIGK